MAKEGYTCYKSYVVGMRYGHRKSFGLKNQSIFTFYTAIFNNYDITRFGIVFYVLLYCMQIQGELDVFSLIYIVPRFCHLP